MNRSADGTRARFGCSTSSGETYKKPSSVSTKHAHGALRDIRSRQDGSRPNDRSPNVDAVRLFGQQLHRHPEACARIADAAHLRDIEVRLRHVFDRARDFSKLIRFRISWEREHLAVLSGADDDGKFDRDLHQRVVNLVRADEAGAEELDEKGWRSRSRHRRVSLREMNRSPKRGCGWKRARRLDLIVVPSATRPTLGGDGRVAAASSSSSPRAHGGPRHADTAAASVARSSADRCK